ncbi:hypothetical protein [Nitrobacter sp. JJSN]|uniref:hypothetical protein n=1 Tax=Nitrobacter sp. JJSN TaxID=3453033 RepID=UPI003F7637CA
MADAIEVLVASANFNERDRAKILSGPLRIPSGKIVWQVLVVFEGADGTEGHAVPFRAAEQFSAFEHNKEARTKFEVQVLDGATVDFSGAVTLPDGRRLRAVEIIPAQMPYDLSDLDFKIIYLTLSMIKGAESRCYRNIRDGLPDSYRDALPSQRLLDFSQLTEGPGRPALAVPLLKQIRAKFEDTYPTFDLPSEQTISNSLAKAGIRIPDRRPRAA